MIIRWMIKELHSAWVCICLVLRCICMHAQYLVVNYVLIESMNLYPLPPGIRKIEN